VVKPAVKKEVVIYLFKELTEVRGISYKWAEDYNYHRPHESLGNQSPIEFAICYDINHSSGIMYTYIAVHYLGFFILNILLLREYSYYRIINVLTWGNENAYI